MARQKGRSEAMQAMQATRGLAAGPRAAPRQPAGRRGVSAVCSAGRHDISRREASAAFVSSLSLLLPGVGSATAAAEVGSLYDFTVEQYGKPYALSQLAGKCSEPPLDSVNYPALREMFQKYHSDGFELLAFPANQFGGQAPGSSDEERAYAFKKFGFEFPVMDKVMVKDKPTPQWDGPKEESPVYRFLKSAFPGEIEWNYVKFLVDRNGVPVRRYSPGDPLDQGLERDLRAALAGEPMPAKKRTVLGAA